MAPRSVELQERHGGSTYERLEYDGELVLQLCSFESGHGRIGDPHDKPYGNGVLLSFEVSDFDACAFYERRDRDAQAPQSAGR